MENSPDVNLNMKWMYSVVCDMLYANIQPSPFLRAERLKTIPLMAYASKVMWDIECVVYESRVSWQRSYHSRSTYTTERERKESLPFYFTFLNSLRLNHAQKHTVL